MIRIDRYRLLTSLLCLAASTVLCSLHSDEAAAQLAGKALIDTRPLEHVERRISPACLEHGPNRYSDLAQYYAAENPELVERFYQAHRVYEAHGDRPYRSMTLVAGAAGVGKTFIKSRIFKKSYPKGEVVKFDIKDLYRQWREAGVTEEKADLDCGDLVLNRLLSLSDKQNNPGLLVDFLRSQTAAFYVIDSLDEIHPDDCRWILDQVEQFVFEQQRPFVKVVIFGRGCAFREYCQTENADGSDRDIQLFNLHAPRFKTTGDLLVSDWNNDGYRYALCWSPTGHDPEEMPLSEYQRWASLGYSTSGEFRSATFKHNRSLNTKVRRLLQDWTQKHRIVSPMIYNLAGNGILRDIVENHASNDLPFDETQVMKAYFTAWLNRDGKSSNRPCLTNPQHLDLYLRLLEEVAAKYLVEHKIDEHGFFVVDPDDAIKIHWQGKELSFSVTQILDRSGLISFDPRKKDAMEYRFEPIWLHRMLVERRNARTVEHFQRTATHGDQGDKSLPEAGRLKDRA